MRSKPQARGQPLSKVADPSAPEVLAVRPPLAWQMLGICASTGWKWVREGKIKVARVGPNMTMVPVAELRDFLARYTTD